VKKLNLSKGYKIMKKTLATILALPLILTACGKQKIDVTLNGMWRADVKNSQSVQITNHNSNYKISMTDQSASGEALIYKFNDEKVERYLAKDNGILNTQVEIAIGEYEKKVDNVITFKVKKHSCVGVNSDYLTKEDIAYEVSTDMKTLVITKGLKKITFTKLSDTEADLIKKGLEASDKGCFSNGNGGGNFKPNPVKDIGGTNIDEKAEDTLTTAVDSL
jgi:predicted secreted protein